MNNGGVPVSPVASRACGGNYVGGIDGGFVSHSDMPSTAGDATKRRQVSFADELSDDEQPDSDRFVEDVYRSATRLQTFKSIEVEEGEEGIQPPRAIINVTTIETPSNTPDTEGREGDGRESGTHQRPTTIAIAEIPVTLEKQESRTSLLDEHSGMGIDQLSTTSAANADRLEILTGQRMLPARVYEAEKTRMGDGGRESCVTITPKTELRFDALAVGDIEDSIELQNTSSLRAVIFKIKTTAPDKFKVRPSYGFVRTRQAINVRIVLSAAHLSTVGRDKFLVAIAPYDGEVGHEQRHATHDEFAEVWRGVDREDIFEHRLMCHVIGAAPERGTVDVSKPRPSAQVSPAPSTASSLSSISLELHEMRYMNRVLLAVMATLLVVLLLILLYQKSVYHSLNAHIDAKCSKGQ